MKKILLIFLFIIIMFQTQRWLTEVVKGERGYLASVISDQRRYCNLYFNSKLCPLFYNKILYYPNILVKNYLTALSINYLFLQRKFFVLELPLFVLGSYFLIQKKGRVRKYILVYFLTYPFFGPVFSLDWPINYWLIKPLLLAVELFGLWNLLVSVNLKIRKI